MFEPTPIASFWVSGEPVPQPRHRFRVMPSREFVQGLIRTCKGNPKGVWRYLQRVTCQAYIPDDHAIHEWKRCIAAVAETHRPARLIEGPVAVDLTFFCKRPQRLMRAKDPEGPVPADSLAVGDWDNLTKAVTDAMTDLQCWWKDDSTICAGTVWKLYHAKADQRCGCMVQVSTLGPADQPELFAESA